MPIEIVNFRSHIKNTLQGYFTVRLSNIGLEIRDATLHKKEGKRWIPHPFPFSQKDFKCGYLYNDLFMAYRWVFNINIYKLI